MDFIDIFDFSKYFKRANDRKNAKIGHVNSVIEQLGYTETIVDINSAQILAMGSTPIELLPTPGVGKYYDVDKVIFEFTYGSVPYLINGDEEFPVISVNGQFFRLDRGLIEYEQDIILFWNSNIVARTPIVSTYCVSDVGITNQSVQLTSSGEVGFGDGTLRVKIYHKTITIGA